MSDWYQHYLVETGRAASLWLLVGFVTTYAVTRWITLRIRFRSTADAGDAGATGTTVKDLYIGGVHIHHQVWGILLVLVTGLLEFRFTPPSPWQELLAVLFGAGAALALDEFALWLHLQDVYWTEEGRKSIDAVMVAGVVGLALLASTSPFGVDPSSVAAQGLVATSVAVVVHIGYTIVCLLKGKIATGLIGLPIPFVALVGAIRLGTPTSFWARRFYSDQKLHRSAERFGPAYRARRERLRDLVSGGHR
ncbi:hypothetical protein SAMN05216199_2271 [Pedococcus cremeus]|uniref:Integral membrane protein n=1 Tax=Pedococcus cremeus TaxID=587636 RepID=A0A1H9V3F8_9MICO|nr:hypothetical protein [Pedococcus cremeus]SES16091.1 hypothetical protein SAMN05216199_2271 [Pedococcus cremeus]